MRPAALKTKIFLDSGDPEETRRVLDRLGFLDGQTTNPTLIANNPNIAQRILSGKKFLSKSEVINFYKQVVMEISKLIPNGSVSVEAYADKETTAADMLEEGKLMFSWIPNAHIKYPITAAGLEAAEQSVKSGMRVNMTLCFTEAQAAAVYSATHGAVRGDVFISSFVGRLDDVGDSGIDIIKNIVRLYGSSIYEEETKEDGHVAVLAASIRNLRHFYAALALGVDIITAPYAVLTDWAEAGIEIPGPEHMYDAGNLKPIPFLPYDLGKDWHTFNINHPLTDRGVEKFAKDWNQLIM